MPANLSQQVVFLGVQRPGEESVAKGRRNSPLTTARSDQRHVRGIGMMVQLQYSQYCWYTFSVTTKYTSTDNIMMQWVGIRWWAAVVSSSIVL